jgi:hypothetical protein
LEILDGRDGNGNLSIEIEIDGRDNGLPSLKKDNLRKGLNTSDLNFLLDYMRESEQ